MVNYENDKLIELVAKNIKNGDAIESINYLSSKIITTNDEKNKIRLLKLRSECYQVLGHNDKALNDIIDIRQDGNKYLSSKERKDLIETKIKLLTQRGEYETALSEYTQLKNYAEPSKGVLWRISLLNKINNDICCGEKISNEHRELIQMGGFQEANNILYTQIIPDFSLNYDTKLLNNYIDDLNKIEIIYKNSNIDFAGKIGNRWKSYCQYLITDAYIQYEFGNKYSAYCSIFLAGMLLAKNHINLYAEGIGEVIRIIGNIRNRKSSLTEILSYMINNYRNFDKLDDSLEKYDDIRILKSAFYKASELMIELIDNIDDLYTEEIVDNDKSNIIYNITNNFGGKNMNINTKIADAANQINVIEKNDGEIVYNDSNNVDINKLQNIKEELLKLQNHPACSNEEKEELKNAIKAAEENNESNLKKALKATSKLGGNILSKITAQFFIEYLKKHGII